MIWFLFSSMMAQLILFNIDEYHFHRQRRLCKKEVYSMIADGALYIIPLMIATFAPFDDFWSLLFVVSSILSSISIIKNEFYYPEISKAERVLHGFLYVLHPVVLYTFYLSWQENYLASHLTFWIFQIIYIGFGFKNVTYQLIYWNYVRQDCESNTL